MNIVQYMLAFRKRDGGVVQAVIDLAEALSRSGHSVSVMTTDGVDAPRDWDGRDGRPMLYVLPAQRIGQGMLPRASMLQAREILRDADVVHLHVPWDVICLQLAGLARAMARPYVVTLHGMLDEWTMSQKRLKKRAYLALGGRRMLTRAAAVQCTAHMEHEQSSKHYPGGTSAVVPLMFDVEPFRHLPGTDAARRRWPEIFESGEPVALALGRLHPIKRVELLIEAAAHLRTRGVPVRTVIAGTGEAGYEARLREHAAALGVADRVVFAGFVDGEVKLSLHQASAMLVHPSAHESFGLAVVEALACGRPAVITRAVNIWPELVEGGGVAVAEPTSESLAEAVRGLLDDPQRRQAMGERGRAWVFSHLEPSRVVAMYESMYRAAPGVK